LFELRKGRGISQELLAERVGLSKATIWFWEKGRSDPSVSDLERVAIALGTNVDYFLDGKNKEGEEAKPKIAPSAPSFFEEEPK